MEGGEPISLVAEPWGEHDIGIAEDERTTLEKHSVAADTPAELCVLQTLLPLQQPVPTAQFTIGRTMFETDRLPAGAELHLNRLDRIWVPSELNRESFVRSGVESEKIEGESE